MFVHFSQIVRRPLLNSYRTVTTTPVIRSTEETDIPVKQKKVESERMKVFHEKLKLQPIPRVVPRERFVDLVLVETDPKNGELLTDTEKDPTKWGDWQNGGRVSDF